MNDKQKPSFLSPMLVDLPPVRKALTKVLGFAQRRYDDAVFSQMESSKYRNPDVSIRHEAYTKAYSDAYKEMVDYIQKELDRGEE